MNRCQVLSLSLAIRSCECPVLSERERRPLIEPDLRLGVFDKLENSLLSLRNPCDCCFLPHVPTAAVTPPTSSLQRNTAADQLLLKNVVHVSQLCFILSGKH